MTSSDQVRALCAVRKVSLSELARRIGQTPQNFSSKLQRNTLSQEELFRIAEALDAQFEQYFVLGNGEIIK